jgi:prepilin-type N-terminal cleavage/methylation domain-containing protein
LAERSLYNWRIGDEKIFITLMVNTRVQKGFTLVELLIVIVVIGVLAAITIVAYNGIQQNARTSLAKSSLGNANRKLEVYNTENNAYPGTLTTLGIADTAQVSYQYRTDASTGYCLTVTATNVSYYSTGTNKSATSGGCAGHGANGVAAITNYVANPSFEGGSSNWSFSPGAGYTGGVSTLQKSSGASSFAMTAPAVGSAAVDKYLEAYTPLSDPGTYYLSAKVYLTSGGATFENRDVWLACESGACSGGSNLTYNRSNLNQWQTFQSIVTITGPATLRFRFYAPLGGTTYVDSVMASKGQSAYADGSTTGWIWNGAAHASTSTGPIQ